MTKYELKDKLKSIKKSTWLWWGLSALAIAIGIALGIVAIYLSGYTLIGWLKSFYPWLIVAVCILIIIITSVLITQYRKKR